jgi:hypothetical protein
MLPTEGDGKNAETSALFRGQRMVGAGDRVRGLLLASVERRGEGPRLRLAAVCSNKP